MSSQTCNSGEAVAVAGLACRLPGDVQNHHDLWELLCQGKNTWSPVPKDRYNEEAFYHPHPENNGTTNHRGGHFVSNPTSFDAQFFGIGDSEAVAIDPQQRLAAELVFEAFEHAGLTLEQVKGSRTSVYAAIFTKDYDRLMVKDTNNIPRYHTTGTGEAILANRISYLFDLKGPSVTLDTGCSGGLVAFHHAYNSIRRGEADIAVALGANLIFSPDTLNGMSNLHMLSDNGRSFSFDARGNGYGRGEGVVALVLRRCSETSQIHAIVRNTGISDPVVLLCTMTSMIRKLGAMLKHAAAGSTRRGERTNR